MFTSIHEAGAWCDKNRTIVPSQDYWPTRDCRAVIRNRDSNRWWVHNGSGQREIDEPQAAALFPDGAPWRTLRSSTPCPHAVNCEPVGRVVPYSNGMTGRVCVNPGHRIKPGMRLIAAYTNLRDSAFVVGSAVVAAVNGNAIDSNCAWNVSIPAITGDYYLFDADEVERVANDALLKECNAVSKRVQAAHEAGLDPNRYMGSGISVRHCRADGAEVARDTFNRRPSNPDLIEQSKCTRGPHQAETVYLPEGVPCPEHDPDEWKKWRASAIRVQGVYDPEDIMTDSVLLADGAGNAYRLDGRMIRRMSGHSSRSQLSDELGTLKTENNELLLENARLRRQVERLERKGKR